MIETVSEEFDACDPHNSRGIHETRLRGGSQKWADKKGEVGQNNQAHRKMPADRNTERNSIISRPWNI